MYHQGNFTKIWTWLGKLLSTSIKIRYLNQVWLLPSKNQLDSSFKHVNRFGNAHIFHSRLFSIPIYTYHKVHEQGDARASLRTNTQYVFIFYSHFCPYPKNNDPLISSDKLWKLPLFGWKDFEHNLWITGHWSAKKKNRTGLPTLFIYWLDGAESENQVHFYPKNQFIQDMPKIADFI